MPSGSPVAGAYANIHFLLLQWRLMRPKEAPSIGPATELWLDRLQDLPPSGVLLTAVLKVFKYIGLHPSDVPTLSFQLT